MGGDVWPGVRPWIFGALGFLVLLILMDWMVPGLLDMWPLLFLAAYGVYVLVYTVLQLRKPKYKRDWSGLILDLTGLSN